MFALSNPSEWIDRYGDYLFSNALMKVGDKESAEDIVQETFLSAFKSRDSYKGLSSEKTWLTSILKRKIVDYYRKKFPSTEVLTEKADTHFFENGGELMGHWNPKFYPKEWSIETNDSLNNKEFFNILNQCIGKMPANLASVFVSKFMEENNSETICKDFSITPSNYWVIIHRAKLLIRDCLEKNWFDK